MKIGVDIDGVILNFERMLKTYGEIYTFFELGKTEETNKCEHYLRNRHNWTDDERQKFIDKYFVSLSKVVPFMPGAVEVIKMLKAEGHKLIIISARGGTVEEMKAVALERFKEVGLQFDKYYWSQNDKLEVAKNEQIDLMIDDYGDTCKKLSENGIKALYFKDVNMKTYEESENFIEVTNWGEIYRIIKTLSDNKK